MLLKVEAATFITSESVQFCVLLTRASETVELEKTKCRLASVDVTNAPT